MAKFQDTPDSAYFYEILNNPDSKYHATVYFGNQAVSGVLNAPVPIAGSNEFSSAKSAMEDVPLVGGVAKGLHAVSDVIKIVGFDTTFSIWETRKIWQESRMPQFNIELTFWSMNAKDRPLDKVKKLYQGLFPRQVDQFLVQAPLGYKFTNKNGDAQGTVGLSIGKYFRANGLVVMDANFTPSLEVMSDGSPLYFTGNITLEPHRMITYDEFIGYFLDTKPLPSIASNSASIKESQSEFKQFASNTKKEIDKFLGQFKVV